MNLEKLLKQPADRRGWLLMKALECVPLDQAINLARAADLFVVGDDRANSNAGIKSKETADANPGLTEGSDQIETPNADPLPLEARGKSGLTTLSSEERDKLLARAAKGATNTELAAEFGLTPRQVQALRMGAARTAVRQSVDDAKVSNSMVSVTPEEVVRYLRQRDDIVVPDNGTFLVNGRFRLDLTELVEKANRVRQRHKKPLFKIEGIAQRPGYLSGNGHPIFRQALESSH